jgi:hypothetical protein
MGAQERVVAARFPDDVFCLTDALRRLGDAHQAAVDDALTADRRPEGPVHDGVGFVVVLDEGDIPLHPDEVGDLPDEVVWICVRLVGHRVERHGSSH